MKCASDTGSTGEVMLLRSRSAPSPQGAARPPLMSALGGRQQGKASRTSVRMATHPEVQMDKVEQPRVPNALSEHDAYEELQCYTLARGDLTFIHQHVVDAWAAQHADSNTKPIGLAFALVGLYLHVEHGFSGRQVQRIHMELSRRSRRWPSFPLPRERGGVTAVEVMAAPPGHRRDQAIDAWCASVWNTFRESQQAVAELLERHGVV